MISVFAGLLGLPGLAAADTCAGNPDALGTARTLALDTSKGLEAGFHFRRPLPLADKEVVLTFDDGPLPGASEKVRKALKDECVKATFFLVGRNALTYPDFVRKLAADGHSIGSHTWSHDMHMPDQPLAAGMSQINRGIAAVNVALKTSPDQSEVAPFFRFPGLNSSHALRGILKDRGVGVFDIDIEGGDWIRNKTPQDVLKRLTTQLAERRRGIILLHDIQPRTAAILPAFLRHLKKNGYKVVHIVPQSKADDMKIATAPGRADGAAPTPTDAPFQVAYEASLSSKTASLDLEVVADKPAPIRKKRSVSKTENVIEKLQIAAVSLPDQQALVSRRMRLMTQPLPEPRRVPPPMRYADARMTPPPQFMPQRREKPKYLLNQLFGINTN